MKLLLIGGKKVKVDTKGIDVPNPILNFENSPFPRSVIQFLKTKYQTPFPIQSQIWPIILKGRDVVGSAETGSGKTLAYLLPIMEHIVKQKSFSKSTSPVGLIVAPTRELVRQILSVAQEYSKFFGIRVAYCHGGQGNRLEQTRSLIAKPNLIITTPGRIIDFIENGLTTLENISLLVLDEADRMFDMGFEDQIKMIISQVRPDRQVTMFSATWPKKNRESR